MTCSPGLTSLKYRLISVSDALEPQVSRYEHSGEINESEIDGASGSGVDTVCPAISVVVEPAISTEPVLVDNNNMQSSSMVLSAVLDEKSGGDASGENRCTICIT